MRIENDPKLDFRDVLIRPKRSTLGSRAEVDVTRSFRFAHTGKDWTGFPLIAANMDVVGTMAMARALLKQGAMVALHNALSEVKSSTSFRGIELSGMEKVPDDDTRPVGRLALVS